MLVAGIVVAIVAVLMILFPQFFMKLKNPKILPEALTDTKVKNAFRIWSGLYVIIGLLLIVSATV